MKYIIYLFIVSVAVFTGCTTADVDGNANANVAPDTTVTAPVNTTGNSNETVIGETSATVTITDGQVETQVDAQADSGISMADVATHNSRTDCWMVIEGNVYDVTGYIASHPGGAQILQGCGTDATELFNDRPGPSGAHSSSARSIMAQFEIGALAN